MLMKVLHRICHTRMSLGFRLSGGGKKNPNEQWWQQTVQLIAKKWRRIKRSINGRMIKFSVLAERLKTKIESVNQTLGTGLNFNVVSDTGEYKNLIEQETKLQDINCYL